MHQLPAAMQAAEQQSRAQAAGQEDLFGLAEPASRWRARNRPSGGDAAGLE